MPQVDEDRHTCANGTGKGHNLRGLDIGHEIMPVAEDDIAGNKLATCTKADKEGENRDHETPGEGVAHARANEKTHGKLADPRRATDRDEDDGQNDGPLLCMLNVLCHGYSPSPRLEGR